MSTSTAANPTPSAEAAPVRRSRSPRPPRKPRKPQQRIQRRQPRPSRPIRPGHPEEVLEIASSVFGVVALVCVWMLMQMLILGGLSEQRSQHLLYQQYRGELAQATAPTGELDYNARQIAPGSPVALLTIPQLGLEDVVVDGTSSGDLLNGPGHLRTTPMPGQVGVSVVMGRAATYGAPFAKIGTLRKGDPISVLNATGRVTYTVTDVRQAGDPIPALPTGARAGRLVLVSAQGSGAYAGLRPRAAIYVDADTARATPAGVVAAAVGPEEQPLGRDTGALPLLVLLLAGLVALVSAITLGRRRFRPVLVWTIASPVAIALAWAVTDQVMRLLPNLM